MTIDPPDFTGRSDEGTVVTSFPDATAVHAAGADLFQHAALESVAERGRFNVALAGGSTPRALYKQLADDDSRRQSVPWLHTEFFWGDERHVPPGDPQSNYRMAYDAMLSKVPVSPKQVHRIHSEHPDPGEAADRYEAEIRRVLAGTGQKEVPRFDLVLLGLGADGHTASLFPGSPALADESRLVVAHWVESLRAHRITMTLPLLNRARLLIFLVTGEEKAAAVQAVLRGRPDSATLPAQLVRPAEGQVRWLLDSAAARLLA
jgi:6-phosphogluconolactonase